MNKNIKKNKFIEFFLFYNIVFLIIEKTRPISDNVYNELLFINSYFLLIVIFLESIKGTGNKKIIHRFCIPIYVFVFYCIVSVFWSEYFTESLFAVMKLINSILVILLCFNTYINSLYVIKNSFNFVAVLNILYLIAFPEKAIYETGEWQGLFLAKNAFASFLLLTFMINTLYYFKYNVKKITYIFGSIILFILILKAQSIAVVFLFILFICINFYLFSLNKINNFILRASVTLLSISVLTVLTTLIYKNIPLIFEYFGKDIQSLTGRDIIWDTVLNYAFETPFIGKGYGGVWITHGYLNTVLYRYMEEFQVTSAHNTFIDIFVNVGLIGLGLFLIILIIFFFNSLKALVFHKDHVYIVILIIMLIQNSTETRIVFSAPIYWFFFVYIYLDLKLKLFKNSLNQKMGTAE
ncbi:exopolysaccharide production protein ExoQ [Peribacillus sp. B2I2]|uniref:O-antigen ligase family protein n=1 Tax=Peribacillus sp. B2I2 TaxID=3156468 RepID=UPI003518F641